MLVSILKLLSVYVSSRLFKKYIKCGSCFNSYIKQQKNLFKKQWKSRRQTLRQTIHNFHWKNTLENIT